MNKIKLSIITVCYNTEQIISKTIESVITQTYSNLEYIIIDGASTDQTLSIIDSYLDIPYIQLYSEKDTGIYDAMNKGISRASGDYLYFLNAGDTLWNEFTLEKVADMCNPEIVNVFYGSIMYQYADGRSEKRKYGKSCGSLFYYLTGDCINHQAMFAHRQCFQNRVFNDEQYRICADRDWMMRVKRAGVPFICLNQMIANYSLDEKSASIREKQCADREARNCVRENIPLGYPVFLLFDFIRNNRALGRILHWTYRFLYIR